MKEIVYENTRFPQIPTGIQLAVIVHYFRNPVPVKDLARRATRSEVNAFAERMNRAHAAFGVWHATKGFETEHPTKRVTKKRIAEVADAGSFGLASGIANTLFLCLPESSFKKELSTYRKNIGFREFEEFAKKIDGVMLGPVKFEGQSKLRWFVSVLDEVLHSPEYQKLSNQYRETLRYEETVKRGEKTAPPLSLIGRREAAIAIGEMIRSKVVGVLPGIMDADFDDWALSGLRGAVDR